LAKIAFLTNNNELIPWLRNESSAFNYDALFGADKPADAYVVLAEKKEDVDEFIAVVEGRLFAWFGEGADKANVFHPARVEAIIDDMSADVLLEAASDLHEQIEEAKRKEKEAKQPARPSLRPRLMKRREEPEEEGSESFVEDIADNPQVIAVGGHGGASFVAWNLAAVTKLPLIEGRKTGSLSKWTGDQTPVVQALEDTLPYGTITDTIPPKSILSKRVIVDCGSDPTHPVFEHARIRIWVTTLDPSQPPVPERVKVIVNRVPDHLPFEAREVVKADIALQVPDGGQEALLTLFTHIPWILKQDREMQEQWKSLIKTQADVQKGATDTWGNTGW
jgi:hypothetical protein